MENLITNIPSETFDLEILDPPYYKTVNEVWDKQWKTEDEYLSWSKEYIKECVRTLKSTGSLYIYGNFDMLTKIKVMVLDELLYFRQAICLNKGLKSIAGRTSDKLRMFPTASEYLLFYTKQGSMGKELVLEYQREYMYTEWKKSGLSIADIKKLCGYTGNQPYHWFAITANKGGKSQWQFPKKEQYLKLQTTGFWQKPYEELLEKFREERFTFELPMGITDVWDFTPDKIRYGHKTQKPINISERIVKSSSKEGDLVFIPFAGSGSEIEACIKHKRKYIAAEINEEYIRKMIKKRLENQQEIMAI